VIEEALSSILSGNGGVTALAANRIYGLRAPQTVPTPYLVFSKIVEQDTNATYCGPDRLVRGNFQFDSYAKTYLTALQLARAVRAALIDFFGDVAGTHISGVIFDMELQLLDPDPGLYRVLTTLFIFYAE
jgi:Protein of unknown function (DUF3168)